MRYSVFEQMGGHDRPAFVGIKAAKERERRETLANVDGLYTAATTTLAVLQKTPDLLVTSWNGRDIHSPLTVVERTGRALVGITLGLAFKTKVEHQAGGRALAVLLDYYPDDRLHEITSMSAYVYKLPSDPRQEVGAPVQDSHISDEATLMDQTNIHPHSVISFIEAAGDDRTENRRGRAEFKRHDYVMHEVASISKYNLVASAMLDSMLAAETAITR